MNPRARGVRIRPGPVLVQLACLCALILGACARPEPTWTPTVRPVPTSATGCGLQSLPEAWRPLTVPTSLTPTRSIRLLAHDEGTGRSLYAKDGTGVMLTEPGAKPKVVLEVRSPMSVWGGAIDGDWMVVLTQNLIGGDAQVTAVRLGGKPFQVFPGGGLGKPVTSNVLLRDGKLFAEVITNADEKVASAVAVDLDSGRRVRFEDTDNVYYFLPWEDAVLLVRPHSDVDGLVRAIDARTFAAVPVPPEVAHLGDSEQMVSDGTTVVRAAHMEATLTVLRPGWSVPRQYRLATRSSSSASGGGTWSARATSGSGSSTWRPVSTRPSRPSGERAR